MSLPVLNQLRDRLATGAHLSTRTKRTFAAGLTRSASTFSAVLDAAKELDAAQKYYDALDAPGGHRWDRLVAARDGLRTAVERAEGAP